MNNSRISIAGPFLILCVFALQLLSADTFAQKQQVYQVRNGTVQIQHDAMRYDMITSVRGGSYLIKIINNSDIDLGIDLNVEKVYDDKSPDLTQHVLFKFLDFDLASQATNVRIAKGQEFVLDLQTKQDVVKYVVRVELFNRVSLLENLTKENVTYRIDSSYQNYQKQALIFDSYAMVRTDYDEISMEFDNGRLPVKATVDSY